MLYHFANIERKKINFENTIQISKKDVPSSNWNITPNNFVLEKIASKNTPLGDYFFIAKGMSTGFNQAFEIEGENLSSFKDRKNLRHLIKNGDIRRYLILDKGERYVIYLENEINLDNLPSYKDYLLKFEKELRSRKSATGKWFHYSTARNKDLWEMRGMKIVVPFMATENRFAIEERDVVSTSGDVNALILKPEKSHFDLKYFLGILNSKVMNFYHRNTTKLKREGYMEFISKQLINLPIHDIDFSQSTEKAKYDKMVNLVENMIISQKRLIEARTPQEKESLQREIAATDRQIDQLVYELYGLTGEEIKIVEGN